MLAAELGITKLSIAKARPEFLLGVSLIATQSAGTLFHCVTIRTHAYG
jgi:hypothetical protein